MKKVLSLILAAVIAATCLTTGMGAFAAQAKKANVFVSVYDAGYILAPTEITVSADLSDKYASSVGFNDNSAEPTILDAAIAASIYKFGTDFTTTAPFTIEDYGYAAITSFFQKTTSAIGYWNNGVMASGITETVTDGSALEFAVYQDSMYYSDVRVNFDSIFLAAGTGDTVTLTAQYESYPAPDYNLVLAPAEGLDVCLGGKVVGTTDANGQAVVTVSQKGANVVTLAGTINSLPILSPWCIINTNSLLTYINKQLSGGAKYVMNGKTAFTCDESIDFLTFLRAGVDMSGAKAGFAASVKQNLDKNGGKLISSYTKKEDIGLYGAVISSLRLLGYDPNSFEGYDIVAAFEAVDLETAVSHPYYYRLAIEAADDAFGQTLCQDLITRYYVMGKGLKYYGFCCDNTCYFLTAIAKHKDKFADVVKDAQTVIKSYTKSNGAYSDNTVVKDVNADSTALAMMAYAAIGNVKEAENYYYWLVDGFESNTGVFTYNGTANSYATKEALLGLVYFKALAAKENFEHTKHIALTKTTRATTKKNGSVVKTCKLDGSQISKTVIYRHKKIKISKKKYKYTGKKVTPKVTVYNSKGKKIAKKYYTVKYKNNKKVGKATITVTFKGNYKGTLKKTFKIVKKKNK